MLIIIISIKMGGSCCISNSSNGSYIFGELYLPPYNIDLNEVLNNTSNLGSRMNIQKDSKFFQTDPEDSIRSLDLSTVDAPRNYANLINDSIVSVTQLPDYSEIHYNSQDMADYIIESINDLTSN